MKHSPYVWSSGTYVKSSGAYVRSSGTYMRSSGAYVKSSGVHMGSSETYMRSSESDFADRYWCGEYYRDRTNVTYVITTALLRFLCMRTTATL